MSTQTFELPDLGEGLTEAEVVRWLVAIGDLVVIDQPVVEVETAKSLVEVPSPYAGRVSELHGAEGATIEVGKPLISVDADSDNGNGNGNGDSSAGDPTSSSEQHREEEQAGSGNVLIGYGTPARSSSRRRRRRSMPTDPIVPGQDAAESTRAPRVTSPLVRHRAREAGISILALTGTGIDGLITRRDIESAIAAKQKVVHDLPADRPDTVRLDTVRLDTVRADTVRPGTDRPGMDESGSIQNRTGLPILQRIPMSGFRKAVSAALTRSRSQVPEATVWVDVDFTDLFAVRAGAKVAGKSVPGLLAYLARFTVAGLRTFPDLNGEVDTQREELVQYAGVNLGMAVQTDRGLMVPAVMGAHLLTTAQLDTEIRRVTDAARTGRATHTELTAGSFTLNNYGAFHVDGSAAIVNHPQVAILGFGRIIDRAWVVDGKITVRKIGQMSFVFDHRVCDGGVAAGFMRVVADAIENPAHAIINL